MADYFRSSDNKEADKRVSETITKKYTMNLMSCSQVGCFEDTFSL